MLACVLAAGDAEAELKVEAFQQLFSKVMPLDHPEVIDGDVPYCELHAEEMTTREDIYSISNVCMTYYLLTFIHFLKLLSIPSHL